VAAGEQWDARSIAPILRGDADAHRDVQVSSLRDWRMATDGRWKLALYDDGSKLLFDLADDPAEQRNLSASNEYAEMIERLTAAIEQALGQAP
jgi:arylsulfatase A-like enzyme